MNVVIIQIIDQDCLYVGPCFFDVMSFSVCPSRGHLMEISASSNNADDRQSSRLKPPRLTAYEKQA